MDIVLPMELDQELKTQAAEQGVPPDQFAEKVLEAHLKEPEGAQAAVDAFREQKRRQHENDADPFRS